MDHHRKRHCWECRRRCLVCDSARPVCKRCSTSGVECPGYGDAKPTRLKWLPPGKVISRRGRRGKTPLPDEAGKGPNEAKAGITAEPAYASMIFREVVIPSWELSTDVCALAECAKYFNSCIYHDLAPIHELGENPHIFPLSPNHLRTATWRPDYLQLGMICMTLSHRINQTRGDTRSKTLIEKFYSYWGLALRSLNEDLSIEDKRTGDTMIAGILTLMLADIQQGTSLNWRCHLEGIHRLIMLRGGFRAVAGSISLEPLLLCLWFISVIGNTTCPASDLTMTNSQLDAIGLLLGQYHAAVPSFLMCPLPLFAEIIRITHLRMRAPKCGTTTIADLTPEAYGILERVHGFSPEQWATSKGVSQEDWALIGRVYQAAVALYCILSLQSLSILPVSPALRACCSMHGRLLQLLIDKALLSPKTKRFMIWPLVVLGVEAVHDDTAMRAFVAKQLPGLSRDLGTYAPLTAKHVLDLFWESGETRWDDCFDRPYVFTGQIAANTSRLSPVG